MVPTEYPETSSRTIHVIVRFWFKSARGRAALEDTLTAHLNDYLLAPCTPLRHRRVKAWWVGRMRLDMFRHVQMAHLPEDTESYQLLAHICKVMPETWTVHFVD